MARILAKETQVQDQEELSTTESESQPNVPFRLRIRKTEVHLEYIIFMENVVTDDRSTKRLQTSPTKLWTRKTAKPPPPPWRQNLLECDWNQFQTGVMHHLGMTLNYLEAFLTKHNKGNRIHWIAMISGNTTYGIKKAVEIANQQEFKSFVHEAVRVYLSKVIIRLQMDDPRKIVKSRANESHARDLLTMQFGPPAVRATIERQYLCQATNPKADIGDSLHPIVVKLRESIAKHSNGSRSKYPSFVKPDDCRLGMQILHRKIWAWAEAICDEVVGVDYTHPPRGPGYSNFLWKVRPGFEGYNLPNAGGSTGGPKQPLHPENNPFRTQFSRTSTEVASPQDARNLGGMGIALPASHKYAPTAPASDVEVLCSTPGTHNGWTVIPDGDIDMLDDPRDVEGFRIFSASPHPSVGQNGCSNLTNGARIPSVVPEDPGLNRLTCINVEDSVLLPVFDPTNKIASLNNGLPANNRVAIPPSGQSLEAVPTPNLGANVGPMPILPSITPLSIPEHIVHPPTSAELEAVDIEKFLNIALIPKNNQTTRARMTLMTITHWSFFRGTSHAYLVAHGFPPGTADLLCAGVARLARHYNTSI
ncbi:hypothetical protein PCANC_17717 [Puccinia coronata f. sp. avenae]|uniref:Uncharacterized protein n=1 Tax=Puccinia coronata f. sp. avenae TaxID=200324 RepID=A0A2N5U0W9_9BASI|nr:hypothetical protein PCANC_17717 [Puccinia coronata f. sp. avenae]